MSETKMPPVHPGEILYEDFMKPLGITQYRLAKEMHVYHAESTRLSMASAPSAQIQHFVWRDTSGRQPSYG
ncbi:MAG: hypothetical protein R3A10_11505 [Caldilineaceae bacterium]